MASTMELLSGIFPHGFEGAMSGLAIRCMWIEHPLKIRVVLI